MKTPEAGRQVALRFVLLGLAATLAAACDCVAPMTARRVVTVDDVVYLQGFFAGNNGYALAEGYVTAYDAHHVGWFSVSTAPADVEQALRQPAALPRQVCDPDDAQLCYRIDGQPKVEVSLDGGQHWQVAWQAPWGRREYMERRYRIPGCQAPYFDLATYDIAYLPTGNTHIVVVAMGTQGVLVHTPEGRWERQAMYGEPIGYAAEEPVELFFTLAIENVIYLLAAVAALFIVPLLGRRRLLGDARGAARVMGIAFLVALAALVAWTPFVFWAYGVIPAYFIALALSLAMIGPAYFYGIRAVRRAPDTA